MVYSPFTSFEAGEFTGEWPERHVLLLPPASENSDTTLARRKAFKV